MTASRGRVPFNAFANSINTALNVLAGFVTLPFLIERLGAASYGIWALIVAVVGYFLFFDSGFTGAVGRLVAGKRSNEDIAGINAVVSTALAASLPLCGLIACAASVAWIPFFSFFDVPPSQAEEVRTALLLAGLATALSLPESIFYAVLWGYERFDLQNLVDVPVTLLRTALIILIVEPQSSLVDLALIVAGSGAAGFLVRVWLCWFAEPRLSLRLDRWSSSILAELLVFGSWFGVLTLSRSRLQNLASFVVGHLLGTHSRFPSC
jgi:O-antigen/teichoic acid export membrane protein